MNEMSEHKSKLTKWILGGLAILFLIISMLQLDIVPEKIVNSFSRTQNLVDHMLPPTMDEPSNVMMAAIESLQIAVMGTMLGIIFSIILSFVAAKNMTPHISVSYLVKSFAAFVRAVPALIWALLFIIAVGLGPTPGILALAVNSIGMLVKVYAESIEEIEVGVIEAIKATGGSTFQVIMQGIIPTIMSTFISWSVFRFDINLRYAAVLGVVGAGGIGWELVRASRMIAYNEMLGITIVMFFMVVGAEYLTRFLKHRADLATIKASE
ncbi:phosphonate transport system permease protein [Virgibacillus natechei]|uniref:Phosphonate transport system permease protein n=1 Tax=Virgibacillus natechei TaxID=1216297 RepID=A0ABS4IC44_9BACI|nr:phosphonate ABC transporter, permease protein PhnE [Virgibacillus natechei]MBP1968508.1 phosphonate transport system permease protein [Virgibacillus natechei]UZD13624.1 phosphonate ABC transporter, permease protein PhnE [Virgibacillus natechei]